MCSFQNSQCLEPSGPLYGGEGLTQYMYRDLGSVFFLCLFSEGGTRHFADGILHLSQKGQFMENNKKKNDGHAHPQKHRRPKTGGSVPGEVPGIRSRDILATPEILSPTLSGNKSGQSKQDKRDKRDKKDKKAQKPVEKVAPTTPAAPKKPSRTEIAKAERAASKADRAASKAERAAAKAERAAAKQSLRRPEPKPTKAPIQPPAPVKEPRLSRRENKKAAKTAPAAPAAATPSSSALRAQLRAVPGGKIRVIPLGGLNEVGKNMTLVEYGEDIIIIDCGMGFPDVGEMPGIDLIIPDTAYLEANRDRIRGMVVTHGHEDHVGAIPYILQKFDIPVYGTRLALGIVENKLEEHTLPHKADLRRIKAGDTVRLGSSFAVEFIHVNHSIADACALAITTPLGVLVHTGDFKLDLTPIEGEMMDVTRFGELGREGVLLLMCESTNAERPGMTPSEKKVGKSLEMVFTMNPEKRIVIATFSSNVHRVQQIIDTSARHGRKVAVTGRSMLNIVSTAINLGYMTVPDGVLIDISDIKRYKPEQLTLITTGSQGEAMSALYRMAFGEHAQVKLDPSDLVVLSSSAIPGNEKLVGRIVNELLKIGVQVINDSALEVHVSGHACQEELKLIQGLTRPTYFMPVHGEYKHLAANRELAVSMGIEPRNIFISDIGKILEIDEKGARFAGTVPSGVVLVDGYGVGDVGNIVLRDRKHLSQDGLIVVVASVDAASGLLLSGPDIVSRGFVYVRESEELMEEIRQIASESIRVGLNRGGHDWFDLKSRIKDDITHYLYSKTKRKPMILPVIMQV